MSSKLALSLKLRLDFTLAFLRKGLGSACFFGSFLLQDNSACSCTVYIKVTERAEIADAVLFIDGLFSVFSAASQAH